ncbi:MAG: histidinol-phosphate aminotransferase family protein [Agarilytica sp.]
MSIFKSHLYALAAYKPPLEGRDPHSHTLLDFNERTIPVSAPIRQALIDYIQSDRLQMYPAYGDIVERLAAYCTVSPSQLMITNGSDQGIELLFRACGQGGGEAIIPAPNFAMYSQCAQVEGMAIVAPHYTSENGLPVAEILSAISDKTRIICIANPNNPSGVGVARDAIVSIAQAAPNVCVLVDECYFEYSRTTVVDLVEQYPNIVVTRTFSKTWGIPSLRFGYLIACEKNISALLSVRGPYDINQLAVVAAQAALENPEYTEKYVAEVMQVSKPLLEKYFDAKGVVYWPSEANYLWAFPQNPDHIEAALRANKILVRPKQDADGEMGLRITIGTQEQTENLMAVLDKCLV